MHTDKDRNHDSDNLVRANDVFFAVHAFSISCFTLSQTFIYKVGAALHRLLCVSPSSIALQTERKYTARITNGT